MPNKPLNFIKQNAVAFIALFFAIGGGGGYAIAATKSTSIHGCVVKRTGELVIAKKCTKKERALVFNQRGPRGFRGKTGATGPASPAAPSAPATLVAWYDDAEGAGQQSGGNLVVVGNGNSGVTTFTPPAGSCAPNTQKASIQVTPLPNGEQPSAEPVAWVSSVSATSFQVTSGTLTNGTFSSADGVTGYDVDYYCAS